MTLFTAWLLPAFGRQWQDRQKARELTASLVAEIGEAASAALITSNFITHGRLPVSEGGKPRAWNPDAFNELDLDWRTRSAEIEARLQAYYSTEVVVAWRSYSDLVHRTYFLISKDLYKRSKTIDMLTSHFAGRFGPTFIHEMSTPWVKEHNKRAREVYLAVSMALLDEKAELIDEILHDHPIGFSTRRSDIVHDLIPFV